MEIIKPIRGRQLNKTHPLNRGLVGCWLFNEGSGSRAFDLSGNGNHGTLQGFDSPPTAVSGWNAGRKGISLAFDGSNDYVDCGNGASLNITDAITIEAWVNADNVTTTNADTGIILKGFYIYGITRDERSTNNKKIWAYINGGGNNIVTNIDLETWQHIVFTYDKNLASQNMKLYVNAVLKGSKNYTSAISTTTANLLVGKNESQYFNGLIDEVRVYNRALSATEIMQLYLNPYCMF